jgi:hypothetical protein
MRTASSLASQPRSFKERDDWMRALVASDLPHAVVRAGICIAMHLNVDSGRCDPSYAALSAATRIKARTLYRLVPLLERSGWIAIQRLNGRINQYVLTTAKAMTGDHCQSYDRGTTAKAMTGVGEATTATGDTPPLPLETLTTANTLAVRQAKQAKRQQRRSKTLAPGDASRGVKQATAVKRAKVDTDEAFAQFWSAYPRRVAKEVARKAYAKAIENGADPEALIAGARRYAAERSGQDQKYTAHPSTWINAQRWQDEPAGAPTIDQQGNIIAVEQPQRHSEPKTWADVLRKINGEEVEDGLLH